MSKRKQWKPHVSSREFMSAIAPAIGAERARTEHCRVLIFCGAGFAKAWSPKSPLSQGLFSIPTSAFSHNESIYRLLDYLNKGESGHLNEDELSEIVTFLELCEIHPFLRGELMDQDSAKRLKSALSSSIKEYYRSIHYINDLKPESDLLPVKSAKSPHRKPMITFLQNLLHDSCEYTPSNVGLDLCFVTTNYDYALESWIQESKNEAVIGDLYRGFTPVRINGEANSQNLIDSPFGLKLFKLNGGFEIVEESDGFAIDYRRNTHDPLLILPSKSQDYFSAYFQSVFEKASIAFSRANVVLFVGYSFPKDDVLIQTLIRFCVNSTPQLGPKKLISISRRNKQSIREAIDSSFQPKLRKSTHVHVYKRDFSQFCHDCNYWYEKVRKGISCF